MKAKLEVEGYQPVTIELQPTPTPVETLGSWFGIQLPDVQRMMYPQNAYAWDQLVSDIIKENPWLLTCAGDMVDGPIDPFSVRTYDQKWENVRRGIKSLDEALDRIAMTNGNHDTIVTSPIGEVRSGGTPSTNLRIVEHWYEYVGQYLFPTVYNTSWGAKNNAFYSYGKLAGRNWGVLCLEPWPRQEVFQWAKEILNQNKDHNIILVTHVFGNPSGGINQNQEYGSCSPQKIANELVIPFNNIQIVQSGHIGNWAHGLVFRPDKSYAVNMLTTVHSQTDRIARRFWVDNKNNTVTSEVCNYGTKQVLPGSHFVTGGMRFV